MPPLRSRRRQRSPATGFTLSRSGAFGEALAERPECLDDTSVERLARQTAAPGCRGDGYVEVSVRHEDDAAAVLVVQANEPRHSSARDARPVVDDDETATEGRELTRRGRNVGVHAWRRCDPRRIADRWQNSRELVRSVNRGEIALRGPRCRQQSRRRMRRAGALGGSQERHDRDCDERCAGDPRDGIAHDGRGDTPPGRVHGVDAVDTARSGRTTACVPADTASCRPSGHCPDA